MSPHHDAPSPPCDSDYNLRRPAAYSSSRYLGDAYDDARSLDSADVGIRRPLIPGVHVPTPAFFDPLTEELDLDTTAAHAIRLAEAGVAGITVQGSNGEAVHLSRLERNAITRCTRKALDDAGYGDLPLVVGCGAQSTKETIELCNEASAAGGDYALILPPAYYQSLFSADTVATFFRDVASASSIPVIIYNYPGAVSGLDLNSDAIIALSSHPNIAGCKLTCGNTGKLNRIASATRAATPSEPGSGFICLGGSADFTLQSLVGGGSGILAGLANIAPKACVKLIALFEAGQLKEARKMQAVVARGDWAAIQGGVVATKAALMEHFGYGGYARKPLPRPSKDENRKWRDGFDELVKLEKAL